MNEPTKHTPGPWHVSMSFGNDGSKPIMAPIGSAQTRLAVVDSTIERNRKTPYDAPDAERDANVALMVSAPELLEALQAALKTADFEGHTFRPWHEKARAAIARATNS